jgi:hypothetical protein
MVKLAIAEAPPGWLPRLFLLTSPSWGAFAGALLLLEGAGALRSRWAPATLALVHVATLGMAGNAMLGSLLQFLPAAAGVRVRGGAGAGVSLHLLLNLGTLLLACGFHVMAPPLLGTGGVLLSAAFALFAAIVAPGMLAARGQWLLHAGIGVALASLLVAVSLGAAMLAALAGAGGLPPLRWADVHAAWGGLGWMLGLLAAVGAVVMPMFQGTGQVPGRPQWTWLFALVLVLVAGTACVASADRSAPLRWGGAGLMATFALAGLWWQWRARPMRHGWLRRAWRIGLAAWLAAACVLAGGGPAVLLGMLVLGVALPWMTVAMQLEIVAFLGWIGLQRECGRGVRLPAVQVLLPDRDKALIFALQGLATLALLAAACWPLHATATVAGLALVAASAVTWWSLRGVRRRCARFLATPRPTFDGRPAQRRGPARTASLTWVNGTRRVGP